jgi:hypothetical protein
VAVVDGRAAVVAAVSAGNYRNLAGKRGDFHWPRYGFRMAKR